ncbi:IclR-like helix-turn-helix domain-containing protein [Couchioplanes caeruleus]|uniref:IclR-like helix-turn-helix domain-containing protein n=2 Tax=Couchioplanes caeruleus TaxID=56438 RepID=A0A3N1GT33_9ACTN|nr:IclR-like helix-turn-helix domain-containing protein [Couchioplanes caeruleus]
MVDRWTVEKAVRASRLEPPGRHIILTLLTYVDVKTATIPERFTPSLTELKDATGYARSTVAEWLNTLEGVGWVIRDRPTVADARVRKKRTVYRLAVPAAALDSLTLPAEPPDGPVSDMPPSVSPAGGPAADGVVSPPSGPAPESPRFGSPAPGPDQRPVGPPAGPELVRHPDRVGPPAGLNQTSSSVDLVGRARSRADTDHPYIEGPNGYCAAKGCAVSERMHGIGRPADPKGPRR